MKAVNAALGCYNLISAIIPLIQLQDCSVQIIWNTSAGCAKPTEKFSQLHWPELP